MKLARRAHSGARTYDSPPKHGTETTDYDFTMKPWNIDEAIDRSTDAGFPSADIHEGVGRNRRHTAEPAALRR